MACKECSSVDCSKCKDPCSAIETALIGELAYVRGRRKSNGCEGFQTVENLICQANKSIADSLTAVPATATHRLLTADCELVNLPASTTFTETPITVFETPSLKLVPGATGNGHTNLQGDVKVSATAGNQVSIVGDGLFVPAGASETSLSVTDSNSIDFTASGVANHTLTADVRLSTAAGNQVTILADGLFVAAAAAETPITVTDSPTIDFSASGVSNHTVTGDVKISTVAGNRLTTDAEGLIVPQCTVTVTSGTQQAIPVATETVECGQTLHYWSESIEFTLADQAGVAINAEVIPSAQAGNALVVSGVDNRLYVPAGNTAVADTSSVNLTLTGSTISADVIISPDAGNAIVQNANGIYAAGLSETPLTVSDTATIGLVAGGLSNHTLSANLNISAAAGNAVTILGDGIYVSLGAETPLTATDGVTIDFTTSGTANHTITGEVKLSANAGNILTAVADGLYAAAGAAAQTPLTANDSTTINLTASGVDNHTLVADVNVSATANNNLTTNPDGLYVFTGLVGVQTGFNQPDNPSAIAALNTLTHPLGTLARVDVAGVPTWFKYDGTTWVFAF